MAVGLPVGHQFLCPLTGSKREYRDHQRTSATAAQRKFEASGPVVTTGRKQPHTTTQRFTQLPRAAGALTADRGRAALEPR